MTRKKMQATSFHYSPDPKAGWMMNKRQIQTNVFHQSEIKTKNQPKSYIFAVGQETNQGDERNSTESEFTIVKSDQIKRQTKQRTSGLRARDFLARHFDFDTFRPDETLKGIDCWLIAQVFEDVQAQPEDVLEITHYKHVLHQCFMTLMTSPSALLMIKEAMAQGWQISISDQGESDFHLDVPAKILTLHDQNLMPEALARSPYFFNTLCVSFIRALRDIWQETRHGGFDEDYGPEYILMLERVRTADCDVLSILVGWELRSEGHGGLWRHLIGSEEGDMAMAFSNYLEKDPSSLFNGKALAASFKQWYQDPARVNSCDHETLEYMDDVLQDYPVGNPFGTRKPTRIGVEILSCLPDRTAYLRDMGDEILADPLYCGLNDEINQGHLMQIMRDMKVTYVEGVPFRDTMLAERIFPDGFVMAAGTETIN